MDPNACMDLICRRINGGAYDLALESAMDLLHWLRRGGFPPSDPNAWQDCGNSAMPGDLGLTLRVIVRLSRRSSCA